METGKTTDQKWFGEWFDSPYYHILYKDRDHEEARFFIDRLCGFLQPSRGCTIIDLACGKGRHSVYLNEKGFDVSGLDLSGESISHAKQFEKKGLSFHKHDMREVFRKNGFDFVFNLFTSFGYFENEAENNKAIQAAAAALKPGGKLILDFMNTAMILKNLVPQETKEVGGIVFSIQRKEENGFIVKDIGFSDGEGKHLRFQERVKAITHNAFLSYFKNAGLEYIRTFGDYNLNPYDEALSDRMVFVARKPFISGELLIVSD